MDARRIPERVGKAHLDPVESDSQHPIDGLQAQTAGPLPLCLVLYGRKVLRRRAEGSKMSGSVGALLALVRATTGAS